MTSREGVTTSAIGVLAEVRTHLADRWGEHAIEAALKLPPEARESALSEMQRAGATVDNDSDAVLRSAAFPLHLTATALADLLGHLPELVFDGVLLSPNAGEVREDVRASLALEVEGLIGDIAAAAAPEATSLRGDLSRARLRRADSALALFDARRSGA